MVFGGFACSRNALISLNVLYIIVSFILIGVAAYFHLAAIVGSLTLVSAVIACGVFLLAVALTGLFGAIKHNQVLLFFYMIILFLLFLLQFSLACACLAVNKDQQLSLLRKGWMAADIEVKKSIQIKLNCCGFEDVNLNASDMLGHPSCLNLLCCKKERFAPCCDNNANVSANCPCTTTCLDVITPRINMAFSVTGGIGLFFSFTEFVGVVLAMRYRNQKDPKANPNAFL